MTLTDNQCRLICHILLTQYNDGMEPACKIMTYAWDVCIDFETERQGAGVLARAIEAGIVWHEPCGEDSTVGLEAKGWAAFKARFGECGDDYDAYIPFAYKVLESLNAPAPTGAMSSAAVAAVASAAVAVAVAPVVGSQLPLFG